ncbi:MAG: chorismate synthase, partial [Acidimicrobiales bacterium]
MISFHTAGESHGKGLVTIVEGLPAGLPLRVEEVQGELARRRLGYGRGPRMRFEADEVTLLAGIRHGRTLGSPVAIEIANTEWPKWVEEMSPHPGQPAKVLTKPRPGHADLAGMQKYGFTDARDVLERASARETAARVAAGTCAKALLARLGVAVVSHVVRLGSAAVPGEGAPGAGDEPGGRAS